MHQPVLQISISTLIWKSPRFQYWPLLSNCNLSLYLLTKDLIGSLVKTSIVVYSSNNFHKLASVWGLISTPFLWWFFTNSIKVLTLLKCSGCVSFSSLKKKIVIEFQKPYLKKGNCNISFNKTDARHTVAWKLYGYGLNQYCTDGHTFPITPTFHSKCWVKKNVIAYLHVHKKTHTKTNTSLKI